jgi:putative NIF3 family GTP cyclohydrolase 1 type 2
MSDLSLTRRDFCIAGSAVAVLPSPAAAAAKSPPPRLSAAELVSRIDPAGAGAFVAGSGETEVTGVMVAISPSIATIRKAQAAGCNLIVSPETPFYGRQAPPPADPNAPGAAMAVRTLEALAADPTFAEKKRLIEEGKLVFYRVPDKTNRAVADALADRLGWRGYRAEGEAAIYTPRRATLRSVVKGVQTKLGAKGGLRTIGDPAMPLKRILIVPGTVDLVPTAKALRDADALICGDLREWELVEYIFDSVNGGSPKALIAIGRILTEQPYAEALAVQLRAAAPGLGVVMNRRADPYWRIQA